MKNLSTVSPDAEVRPQGYAIDFQGGLRNEPLRYIALTMGDETAQTRSPHCAAADQAAPSKSMQGFEYILLFSLRQSFQIVGANHMRLWHMIAQNSAFIRLYFQLFVPMWQ